jgi:hypothetical protein
MHVDLIFRSVQTDLVRTANNFAALDPSASHPHAEAVRIVIASSRARRRAA